MKRSIEDVIDGTGGTADDMPLPEAMCRALAWANAPDEAARCAGFALIGSLAAGMPEETPGAIGFFDHAMFLARKYASDESPHLRRAVAGALCGIGERNADLRDAAVETAEEIAMQPSEDARRVASQALAELTGSSADNRFRDVRS